MAVTVSSVDAYLSEFDRFERQQGPRDPSWVGELRKAAIQRFAEAGFPTIKNEDWKYTNVAPIAKTPFRIARVDDGHGIVGEKLEAFAFGMLRATQLVFVNGHDAPRLSLPPPPPSGPALPRGGGPGAPPKSHDPRGADPFAIPLDGEP